MKAAACVGRVGGLAVALGVGVAVATGAGVASAAPADSTSSSSSSSGSSSTSSASSSTGSSQESDSPGVASRAPVTAASRGSGDTSSPDTHARGPQRPVVGSYDGVNTNTGFARGEDVGTDEALTRPGVSPHGGVTGLVDIRPTTGVSGSSTPASGDAAPTPPEKAT